MENREETKFEYKELTLGDIEMLSKVCEHKIFICDADTKTINVEDKGE